MIYQDVFAPAAQCRCRRAILAGMVTMAYRVIPAKGHSFNVEMNNLKGKCSFRDESDGCVDCADQADELDPTDRVIARKSGRHG
jgi:hypothetical protein